MYSIITARQSLFGGSNDSTAAFYLIVKNNTVYAVCTNSTLANEMLTALNS